MAKTEATSEADQQARDLGFNPRNSLREEVEEVVEAAEELESREAEPEPEEAPQAAVETEAGEQPEAGELPADEDVVTAFERLATSRATEQDDQLSALSEIQSQISRLQQENARLQGELQARTSMAEQKLAPKEDEPEPSFDLSEDEISVLAQYSNVDPETYGPLLSMFSRAIGRKAERFVDSRLKSVQTAMSEQQKAARSSEAIRQVESNIETGFAHAERFAGDAGRKLIAQWRARRSAPGRNNQPQGVFNDSYLGQWLADNPTAVLSPKGVMGAVSAVRDLLATEVSRLQSNGAGKESPRMSSESSAAGGGGGSELTSAHLSTQKKAKDPDEELRAAIRNAGRKSTKTDSLKALFG